MNPGAPGRLNGSASSGGRVLPRFGDLAAIVATGVVALGAAAAGVSAKGPVPAAPPPYQVGRPLTEPALFGEGVVSTGEFESHAAFTPDGRTLYYVKSTPAFTDWTIYVTRFSGGRWSKPRIAPFSGRHRDADPFVTTDGLHLYFISDRPVDGRPKADMDIWAMDRAGSGDWGEPRNLGAPVNSPGSEWLPRLVAGGALYFGSDRPGGLGRTDLYRAAGAGGRFEQPENLGPAINSPADEYEPCIAPDESFLVFMAAGRADDLGGGDLYITYRQPDGRWAQARNLGPKINGPGLEISPYLTPDGKYFFFSSARGPASTAAGERLQGPRNGLGDIYQMDLVALHALAK
jgi:Tol biopolymer transport system component